MNDAAADRRSEAFLVVVSGPSGVGKTTIVERVVAQVPRVRESISVTTRAPREGEVDGRDYFFVDEARFETMKVEGELLEWAHVHGAQYGTPSRFMREQLAAGFDLVLNIDIQGGNRVKKLFPATVTIFILPPSFEALEARIRGRGSLDDEALRVRLENAREEIAAAKTYDYLVVNDELDDAVARVQAVILAERCRRERQKYGVVEYLIHPPR